MDLITGGQFSTHCRAKIPGPSPLTMHGTFGLGVVHCKHIDSHELQHVGASDGRWAVLQQHLELPQDLLSHCRERLHPADRKRTVVMLAPCPQGTVRVSAQLVHFRAGERRDPHSSCISGTATPPHSHSAANGVQEPADRTEKSACPTHGVRGQMTLQTSSV